MPQVQLLGAGCPQVCSWLRCWQSLLGAMVVMLAVRLDSSMVLGCRGLRELLVEDLIQDILAILDLGVLLGAPDVLALVPLRSTMGPLSALQDLVDLLLVEVGDLVR